VSKRTRKNLNLAISGCTGRMGREISRLARKTKGLHVVAGVSRANPWTHVDPRAVNMVVDFSLPEAFDATLDWCVKNKKPLLCGTTGLTSSQRSRMRRAAKKIPILWASNMSLGVAVLRGMLNSLSPIQSWSFAIEETHHRHKKDKPSGTALTLQNDLEKVIGRRLPKIRSVRGGEVAGIHKITAKSKEEVLTLEHKALNRTVFARGALTAARWLFDKKRAGLYDLGQI
jgi:4-hydroxy-tetrahydrodipicolinate reductase